MSDIFALWAESFPKIFVSGIMMTIPLALISFLFAAHHQ